MTAAILTPLAVAEDGRRYGNKAAGLAAAARQVQVPVGFVVPSEWIRRCLGPDLELLDRLLDEVSRAAEDRLSGMLGEIEAVLGRLRFGEDHSAELAAALESFAVGPRLVVRSSSADEDGSLQSFAGVFESLINVEPAELAEAVRQVWQSAFSPKALLQYRRLGRPAPADRMSVLVQRAIQPELAGVAFSEPTGDAYVEWATGHGADLVGGLSVPTGERLSRSATVDGWREQLRACLVTLSRGGRGHDVEWAWDGVTVWVVQVRPRTAAVGQEALDGLRTAPLYEGDAHDLVLGDCAGEYTRIRNKRRVARAIALTQGARVPAGWLVNWDPAASAEALLSWSEQLPRRVVLDSSATERQYIIDRGELADTVTELAANRTAAAGEFAFLCREYLRGETALLSTVAGDGSVYVEASEEGLLALNRGFGAAHPVTPQQLELLIGSEQAQALERTTREQAKRLHPRATLEWVISEAVLYFVDYSAPMQRQPASHGGPAGVGPARVLSPGLASGRVQHLSIDALLTETSIAPIISISQPVSAPEEARLLQLLRERLDLDGAGIIVAVSRPIAVLSMLIGLVEGVLFEEGALLSHLGILLREAGVPAAIVGTGNLPPAGSVVELVHGTVLILADEQRSPAGT